MRLALIGDRAAARVGIVRGERVVDVARLAEARGQADPALSDLSAVLAGGAAGRDRLAELCDSPTVDDERVSTPLAAVRLRAPLVAGAKILCHVVNYADHGAEADIEPPDHPFFFLKPGSAVVGPEDPIIRHTSSAEMDYEVELAAVIGKAGSNIPEEQAYEHIAGYVVLNDVSYRDLQFNRTAPRLTQRFGQNWTQGKGLDGSCPIGPWIALRDEVTHPYPLRLTTSVDGDLRQDASTDSQIFKLPALIASVSIGMTLQPGDIVATGTPSGSAVADGRYLQVGQTVRCEIEGIGALVNEVIAG